ncbi:MAG TPA: hypothetical protein PLZ36_01760 [Armatimonadota bacterium]|nr:hypothetical protein [Armatimonadota bacterium]
MSRIPALLAALVLTAGLAQALTITRVMRKPDGAPAAGAVVIVRTLTAAGALKEERRVIADARGAIAVEMAEETPPLAGFRAGYLLIAVPGCALTLAELSPAGDAPPGRPDTLRLFPAYRLPGTVQTAAGTPVAGAAVTVHVLGPNASLGFQTCPVNAPAARLSTPALTAASGPDGAFTLPGVVIARPEGYRRDGGEAIPISVSARAAGADGVLAGEARLTFHPGPLRPGDRVGENRIVAQPAMALRGTVLHAVTGLPVAGAAVRLTAPLDSIETRPPVVTKADGTFDCPDVPADVRIFAVATHPQLASAWRRLTEPADDGAPRRCAQTTLLLRPLAQVRGALLDPVTRRAPAAPITVIATADEGYHDGIVSVGRASVAVRTGADGAFAFTTAIGGTTLTAIGPGYRSAAGLLAVGVPLNGLEGVSIPLAREQGLLCRLDAETLAGLTVEVRLPGADRTLGGVPGVKADGWWFYPLADGAVEVRVLRYGMPVTPWQALAVEEADWPVILAVP